MHGLCESSGDASLGDVTVFFDEFCVIDDVIDVFECDPSVDASKKPRACGKPRGFLYDKLAVAGPPEFVPLLDFGEYAEVDECFVDDGGHNGSAV